MDQPHAQARQSPRQLSKQASELPSMEFEVVKVLGKGAQARVYLAFASPSSAQLALPEQFALKVFNYRGTSIAEEAAVHRMLAGSRERELQYAGNATDCPFLGSQRWGWLRHCIDECRRKTC